VVALKTIGAQDTAAIAQRALNAVNQVGTWSRDADRQASIKLLPSATRQTLEELDQEYYACREDLTPLLYKYVAKHRTEIGAPADF
jgi:uncharacterized protein DUF4375